MASRNAHDVTGALAGGAVAAVSARNEQIVFQLIEILGGVVGGVHGSRIPDGLEPALTPRHRGPAHSLVAGFALGSAAIKHTPKHIDALRAQARDLDARSLEEPDFLRALLLFLAAAACHFASGYLLGAATGYGSHLALDALTPESLPVLVGHA